MAKPLSFLGKIGNVSAAVVANKAVFLRALRTALFSALCANAVVVGIDFFVAAGTSHSFYLCNNFFQFKVFSNIRSRKKIKANKKAHRSELNFVMPLFVRLFNLRQALDSDNRLASSRITSLTKLRASSTARQTCRRTKVLPCTYIVRRFSRNVNG